MPLGQKNGDSEAKMRRREALGAIGGGSLLNMGDLVGKIRRATRIVTARKADDSPLRKRKVPKKWYEAVSEAKKAHKTLMDSYSSRPEVDMIAITYSNRFIGKLRKPQPIIRMKPNEYTDISVQDYVQGVKIKKEVGNPKRGLVGHGGCHNNSKFDPFPGGVTTSCLVSDNSGNPYEKIGTSGYVTYKDGTYYMVSAAHLTNYGCSDWAENTFYNPHVPNNEVGVATLGDPYHDWVVYEANNSGISSLDNVIVNSNDGVHYQTAGYYTYDGLQYHMNNATEMTKQGQTMGSSTAPIEYINNNASPPNCDKPDMHGYGVSLKMPTATGDSGGPVYRATQNNYGEPISIIVMHVCLGVHPSLIGSPSCSNVNNPDMYDWAAGWPAYQMASIGYSAGIGYDS